MKIRKKCRICNHKLQRIISFKRILPLVKTIALGGVATGNIKAKEEQIVAGRAR